MNKAQFDGMCGQVKPLIQNQDTQLRSAIPAAERLLDVSFCHVVVGFRLPNYAPQQEPIDNTFAINMSTKSAESRTRSTSIWSHRQTSHRLQKKLYAFLLILKKAL